MAMVSTKAVAEALSVSERSVRMYASAGRIPFVTTPGGHRRFDLDAVLRALQPQSSFVPTLESLRRQRKVIVSCARRHGARDLRVFGSVASGQADEDSDVDLLVALEPDRGFADIEDLEAELADLLGVHVDVLTEGACHGPFATIPGNAVAL